MEIDRLEILQEKYLDYKERNDKFGMIHSLKNIGIKYSKTEPLKAINFFRKSLNIIKNLQPDDQDDKLRIKTLKSQILYGIGETYQKMAKNKKAIKNLSEASELSKEIGNNALTAAIASSIISMKSQEHYNGISREKRVKNQFKYMWVYFLLSVIPWIIIILLLFIIV